MTHPNQPNGYANYPERHVPPPSYYQPPTTGYGIAALILGLLGVSILAVIFGAVGISEVNKGFKSGKGFAVTGLILGLLGSVLWFALLMVGFGAGVSGSYR